MNHSTFRRLMAAASLAACSLFGTPATAAFTGTTFFGDSLSDTGNVLSLTQAFGQTPFPNFPGAPGRFSNGPVWTEYLASGLGLPTASAPSNLIFNGSAVVPIGALGGQNFAFGGARTGLGGSAGATTGLLGQLVAWNGAAFSTSLSRMADPDALYVVVAGANDLRDFRSGVAGAPTPEQVAGNIVNVLALLAQSGAEHFLIANLPDLGKTPEAMLLGLSAQSTAATLSFNAALALGSGLLDAQFLASTGTDLDIRTLDLYGLGEAVYDDAVHHGGSTYGITNVSTACIAPVAPGAYFYPGSVDINCAVSAYSDVLHPSATAGRLIGTAALNTVTAAVPEPQTYALVACGLALVVWRGRRRARA